MVESIAVTDDSEFLEKTIEDVKEINDYYKNQSL